MTADRTTRDQLAAALRTFCDLGYEMSVDCADALAESGVVDRLAAERAAAELREAATEQPYAMCLDKRILNRRADELDPT